MADDVRDYIARSRLRRIQLLEDQLSAIRSELEERGELHRETMKELESSSSRSACMSDTGSSATRTRPSGGRKR